MVQRARGQDVRLVPNKRARKNSIPQWAVAAGVRARLSGDKLKGVSYIARMSGLLEGSLRMKVTNALATAQATLSTTPPAT